MLSSPAEGASKFSHLPARPPTPPRDTSKTDLLSPDTNKTVEDALRFLDEGHQDTAEPVSSARVTLSTDTPPPKSSQPRGSTASKKVGFVLESTNQIHITGLSDTPRVAHDSPAPRSSGPLKSILKRSIEQLPPTPDDVECRLSYFSPQEPGSFRKMLQSVLKQLAGTSRDARRDAYLCLNGALKQYSDLPEREALVDKMDLLQQFITRDMAWKDPKGEGLDVQIVTQALNLTSALLWDATTEQALDVDFRTFVIDRSIIILEQADAPKPVVKAHVHILMMQHFPSSIVTGTKVERILASLQTIEERCSGNSVVAARLTVYQKLVTQQPSVMLSRMEDWIGHVLTGLLSSINDTRIRAIEACHYAALRLGSYPLASKTLFELSDAETDEGSVYCEYFNKRLMEMTSDKELAQFVPQIWVAVILFFRSKRKPLDRYPRLRLFLATIQRCLNSGDMTVKHHAHIAWNKLIFAVSPDSSTSQSMRSMLRLPIMALLDRRCNDRFTLQAKELALQSYCHLLNTGLRPNLSHEELDAAWKLYVEEGIEKLVKSGRRTHAHACRLLHGLLQRKKPTYNENAAVESTPIRPEDLPSLDAKWVRSRLGRIIKVVEPVIAAGMCSPPDVNEAANSCWRSLFQTVAEAGSQEVKTSNELKIALAELINFFRRLWHAPAVSRTPVEISLWLDRYQLLLEICVEGLGTAHFVEDFLAKTNADEVEATPTPSNRTSKHQKTAYSPFVFLLALYYQQTQRQDSSDAYVRSAAWYLDLLAGARGSASGTIGLLHRSLQFCADQHPSADNGEEIWAAVADSAVHALVRQTSAFLQHNSQTVGTTLRSALNVIIFDLRNYPSSSLCSEKATQLYRAACNFAKHYGGDGGVALGVMEPLAKSLLDMHEDLSVAAGLRICGSILENGVWPKSRQELEQSRKALWSVSLDPPSKSSAAVFDPFDLVYSVICAISQNAYENLAEERQRVSVAVVVDHFAAITKFLSRCPAKIIPSSLKRLQTALSLFAQDRSRALFPLSTPETDDGMRKASAELPSIWADVLRLVQHSFPEMDSVLLEALEPLVTAGLASPSKDIVNHTITFWNESFGSQDTLEYPAKLLPVLRARRAQAEMQLPGLIDDETHNVEIAELPVFAESQEVSPSTHVEKARSPMPTSTRSNFLFNSPLGTPYLSDTASATKKRTKSSRKSTPKARLRHDNSQLEFAPIDSTSACPAIQESQMLTEHQKEVKARQHGDAQMFPELSSSPGRLESKGRTIAKKLDFSSDAARGDDGNQALATPTAPADANPMSDDLPSSPTPRANGTMQEPDQCSDDDATDIIDPPSSPPRRAEDLQDDDPERFDETTIDMDQTAAVQEAVDESGQDVAQPARREEAEQATTSDLVSDCLLPNAQLEREAAAAAAGKGTEVDVPVDEEVEEPRQSPAATHDSQDWGSQTPSRVEESFIEQFEQTATPSNAGSTRSTPKDGRSGGKKRQRALDAKDSPRKKTKKASPSPIKEFWKRLTGSQSFHPGDGEDDDIEEEIVVASRPRPSLSVEAKNHTSQDVPEPETAAEPDVSSGSQEQQHIKRRRGRPRKSYSQEQFDPAPSTQEESQLASQPPVKRVRGRPRKHPVDESSQTSTVKAGLKRRASTISNATRDDQEETSVVAETPALPVTRKAARLSQGASDAGSSLRQGESQEENVDQEADRPSSSAGSASPKNILARLYGVLSDIPKMVFGSQKDERAFDDVLFDIRREVHEAGRRARQQ